MQYRMREKIWTLRDRYLIRDADDREVYAVEGKLLSIGKKLRFCSMDGDVLARIEQKVLAWRSTYFVLREGQPAVRVRRMFWPMFRPRYEVDAGPAGSVELTGNFWAYEYRFTREGRQVGTVSRKIFSWADSYCVDIDDDEDQVLLLAATVIVDLVSHESRGAPTDVT